MDLSVSKTMQEIYDGVSKIKKDVHNDALQKLLMGHIADIMEYTVARNDKMFAREVFDFIVEIFMTVGELDYDSVEPLLDILTTSRIIIKKMIV